MQKKPTKNIYINFETCKAKHINTDQHIQTARSLHKCQSKSSSCSVSPLQLHVSLAPHIFSSSLQEHFLIKAAEANGLLHADVKDGLGRVLPSLTTVQETHLKQVAHTNEVQEVARALSSAPANEDVESLFRIILYYTYIFIQD